MEAAAAAALSPPRVALDARTLFSPPRSLPVSPSSQLRLAARPRALAAAKPRFLSPHREPVVDGGRGARDVVAMVVPFLRGAAWEQPPPDLASFLYKNRIVYLGMCLVPSVTELMLAEFLYLQYDDAEKPIYLYINSTGTTKNGEKLGYETEALAVYDAMRNMPILWLPGNGNWIRSLRMRITSAVLLQEFVGLWIRIQSVQLQPEVSDSITWKWTTDGVYSTRSTYRVQFRGSHRKFQHDLIWKAKAENKCKIHAWILLHDKILTADNLQKRGWPHQEHCALCNSPLENGLHLSLLCPFARAVWDQVLSWENFAVQLPQQDPASLATWWEHTANKVPKHERRRFNGVCIYIVWNLWKEKNRRIFQNVHMTAQQVASMTKDDIMQRHRAMSMGGQTI